VPSRKTLAGKPQTRSGVLRPLGAQLRRLRLERKLTQQRLAELAGLNYKYLGRIELARADPGAEVLVRLARALTVPVGDLFETITPRGEAPLQLSPADLDDASGALATLAAVIERTRTRQPRTLPLRAPRRPRR
jgi:transcriptional regulator with XRE-family HTH domain